MMSVAARTRLHPSPPAGLCRAHALRVISRQQQPRRPSSKQRCRATSKHIRDQCRNCAMMGKGVCRIHGGATPPWRRRTVTRWDDERVESLKSACASSRLRSSGSGSGARSLNIKSRSTLQQEGTDLVDDAGTLAYQALAHTMQRLQVQLIGCLAATKLHETTMEDRSSRRMRTLVTQMAWSRPIA